MRDIPGTCGENHHFWSPKMGWFSRNREILEGLFEAMGLAITIRYGDIASIRRFIVSDLLFKGNGANLLVEGFTHHIYIGTSKSIGWSSSILSKKPNQGITFCGTNV